MRGTVERYGRGWRYRLESPRDPATARRRYVTKGGFRTEREAQRALNRILVKVDDGAHVQRSKVLVGVTTLRSGSRGPASTCGQLPPPAIGAAVVKLNAAFGAVRLQDLTAVMIENCYTELLAAGLGTEDRSHMCTARCEERLATPSGSV